MMHVEISMSWQTSKDLMYQNIIYITLHKVLSTHVPLLLKYIPYNQPPQGAHPPSPLGCYCIHYVDIYKSISIFISSQLLDTVASFVGRGGAAQPSLGNASEYAGRHGVEMVARHLNTR
jgi:hypothetical protein